MTVFGLLLILIRFFVNETQWAFDLGSPRTVLSVNPFLWVRLKCMVVVHGEPAVREAQELMPIMPE